MNGCVELSFEQWDVLIRYAHFITSPDDLTISCGILLGTRANYKNGPRRVSLGRVLARNGIKSLKTTLI